MTIFKKVIYGIKKINTSLPKIVGNSFCIPPNTLNIWHKDLKVQNQPFTHPKTFSYTEIIFEHINCVTRACYLCLCCIQNKLLLTQTRIWINELNQPGLCHSTNAHSLQISVYKRLESADHSEVLSVACQWELQQINHACTPVKKHQKPLECFANED